MKNPRIQLMIALASICLTLIGVAGLAYKIFRPEGWLVQALGLVWNLQLHYSLMVLPVLIAAIVLGIKLFTGFFDAKSSTFGNWLTGAFMALGWYFIARLVFFGGV
ncbi:MAG TPA: hypothetical protein VNN78_02505 [Burkholderiales bacterium]|nr:hypothetical protein [Burkholderiales bacterium]